MTATDLTNQLLTAEWVQRMIDYPEQRSARETFTDVVLRKLLATMQREAKLRMVFHKPTEAMCTAARGFVLGLDLGFRNFADMQKHLDRGGYPTIPYIREMAAHGQGSHITKWDVADCIWQLMASVNSNE